MLLENESQNTTQNIAKMTAKAAISSVVLAAIFAQAYTGIIRLACGGSDIPYVCGLPEDPGLYPFLNYPMYRETRAEGTSVSQYTLVATFKDGSEKLLNAEDFDLSSYWFNSGVVKAFREKEDSKIAEYVETYNKAGNQPFVSIRLDDSPLTITREAVIESAPSVVKSFSINASEENNERE
ncbi:MAG: hypothetical protein WA885_17220 [Phormidesmis sp.]